MFVYRLSEKKPCLLRLKPKKMRPQTSQEKLRTDSCSSFLGRVKI